MTGRARQAGEDLLERIGAPGGGRLPRLLLVFAHPDDEVLAVGARLERMAESALLTLTDGAPRNGMDARNHGFATLPLYQAARQQELQRVLEDAALHADFVRPFPERVADQETAYHLVDLSRSVAKQIAATRPEAVLTHPYEGGHPDHDACAFAVHCAERLLAAAGVRDLPVLLEAPSYHAGENGSMRTGSFLRGTAQVPTLCVELTESEIETKRRRLACFASQVQTLTLFEVKQESFRIAPAYDFTAPPHPGQLLYEGFGWEMTGERFRRLASEALQQLFPAQASPRRDSTAR